MQKSIKYEKNNFITLKNNNKYNKNNSCILLQLFYYITYNIY